MSDLYFKSKYGLIDPPVDNQDDGDWDYEAYGRPGYSDKDVLNSPFDSLAKNIMSVLDGVNLNVDNDFNPEFDDEFKVIIVGSTIKVTTGTLLDNNQQDKRYKPYITADGVEIYTRRYFSDGSRITDTSRTHSFRTGDCVYIKPQAAKYKSLSVKSYEDFAAIVNGPALVDSEQTKAVMPTFKREHYDPAENSVLGFFGDLIRYSMGQYAKLSENKDPNDYIIGDKNQVRKPSRIDDVNVLTDKKFWVINDTPTSFELSEFPPSQDGFSPTTMSNVSNDSGKLAVSFYTPGKSLMVSSWGHNLDPSLETANTTEHAKDVIKKSYEIARQVRSYLDQIPKNPEDVKRFIANLVNFYGQDAWNKYINDPINKWATSLLNMLSMFDGFHPGVGLTSVTLGQLIGVYTGFNMRKMPMYFRKLVIVLRSVQQQLAVTSPTEASKYDGILLMLEAVAGTGEGYELALEVAYIVELVMPLVKAVADAGSLFFNPSGAGMVVNNILNEGYKLGLKLGGQTRDLLVEIAMGIPVYLPTNLARIIV